MGAMFYLWRLTDLLCPGASAPAAVLFCSAFPFAVFFGAAYTESLFLCASVACFYYFCRGSSGQSFGWGVVAGLTRQTGFLIAVPILIAGLGVLSGHGTLSARRGQPISARSHGLKVTILCAAGPIVGMLSYSIYVYWLTGYAFAWVDAQASWGRVNMGTRRRGDRSGCKDRRRGTARVRRNVAV